MINNASVIIRSVGERTEALCQKLVAGQFAEGSVEFIKVSPFSFAHKRSLEIGLERGKQWTVILDADVLVVNNLEERLSKHLQEADESVYFIHTQMLDKFFGGPRYGGVKFYRTSLLPEAIKLVPVGENVQKPETETNKRMKKLGYNWLLTGETVSAHDFEQSYSDLFRKGFTHSIKHDRFLPVLLPYWLRMAEVDDDFKVLLSGVSWGKEHKEDLHLDVHDTPREVSDLLSSLRIEDKQELNTDAYSLDHVNKLIDSFESPIEYNQVMELIEDTVSVHNSKPSFMQKFRSLFKGK